MVVFLWMCSYGCVEIMVVFLLILQTGYIFYMDNLSSEGDMCNSFKNSKPVVGMLFDSMEEAYSFYKRYGVAVGFDVRKGPCTYKKNVKERIIGSKMYLCHKAGFYSDSAHQKELVEEAETSNKKEDDSKKCKRKRSILREGCPALLRVISIHGGKWQVKKFVEEHNHEVFSPHKKHFLKENRKVTSCHKNLAGSFDQANIRTSQFMSFLEVEAGGYENIGFTERDLRNEIGARRIAKKAHDADMLIEHFNDTKETDPSFYFSYRTDEEGRLKDCFWVDGLARKAYHCFGQIVVFDTTYDTNEYSLIFAPFTGINHHEESICFGSGFLSNESADSFVWLFTQWKEAMSSKLPDVIFTDQDLGIGAAIKDVFPATHHKFCAWHIMDKATAKLGLTANSPQIKDLHKCVWNSEFYEDFKSSWDRVVSENGWESNKWLSGLFEIRDKWVPSCYRGIFTARVRTTQRSESMNSFYDKYVTKKNSLMDFYIRFTRAISRQRHNQLDSDRRSLYTKPKMTSDLAIEIQMASIYTRKVFYRFKEELDKSMKCSSRLVEDNQDRRVYMVKLLGNNQKVNEVIYSARGSKINCSCLKYESEGIPCWHILSVLRLEDIEELPKHLILKRWTVDVMSEAIFDADCINLGGNRNDTSAPKKMQLLKVVHEWLDVGSVADHFEETKQKLLEIGEWLKTKSQVDDVQCTQCTISHEKEIIIHPPSKAKTKGSGKRYKGGKEKNVEREKRRCHGCNKEGVDHDKRNCPDLKNKL